MNHLAPAEDRFWCSVLMVENCWEWLGSLSTMGYGRFTDGGVPQRPHRWAYERFRGPIPKGLTIDHLCRNRKCVNPDHLEVVIQAENLRRGNSPPAINGRKTHCKHGHALDAINTGYTKTGRLCLACRVLKNRARKFLELYRKEG
jgi:HNH endonuclease